jgi:hypothetical protein
LSGFSDGSLAFSVSNGGPVGVLRVIRSTQTALLGLPSISFQFAIRLSAFFIFFPAQGPIPLGGKKNEAGQQNYPDRYRCYRCADGPGHQLCKAPVGLRAGLSSINHFAHGRHSPNAATLSSLKSDPDSYF